MGNDGGSFQQRGDLVKEKPKEVKIDSIILAKFRARLCTLSKQRLKKPIVMCRIGNLYNFQDILKNLMEKSMPVNFSHIKRTKDVKEVKLEANPDEKSEFPFICPLTQIEFNGINKFVGLWECGCVFSEKLISKNKGDSKKCPICTKSYSSKDVISLNLTPEDAELKRKEILTEQSKKDKKSSSSNGDKKNNGNDPNEKIEKKQKTEKNSSQSTAGLTTLTSHKIALIEKLTEQQKESEAFKSLFHNDSELKKEDNLFTRNVRFGIR